MFKRQGITLDRSFLVINRKTPSKYFASFHHGPLRRQTNIVHELKERGLALRASGQPINTGTAAGKAMAGRKRPRTTKLYDRTKEQLTQDEGERIRL
jgi:hypothetical protein